MVFGNRWLTGFFWLVTALLFVFACDWVVRRTPAEATMGDAQKIFYLHLPVAINTFLACFISFIASGVYLFQRRRVWDDLAAAAARVAVLLCTVVLVTGMVWGKSAWGAWWTWSPRLTFSLVLWLLYVVYLIIRPSIESAQRRALISAVYGVVAFLDVPLVYLSVRLMKDIHPTSVQLLPAMKLTLLLWFAPVTLMAAGLLVARFRLEQREHGLAGSAGAGSPGAVAAGTTEGAL